MSENDLNNGLGKPLIVAGLGDVGAQMDRCFVPLGLQLESGFGTRKYVGEINGRFITITIAARSRNQYIGGSIRYRKFTGLWLDISMTTPVMTRLMLGQPNGFARSVVGFVQRLYGNKPVAHLSPAYEPFVVFAHDSAWAEMFLADTVVQIQLTTLLRDPNLPPSAAIFLSPGKWVWTTSALPDSFTPEVAQTWLAQLTTLAAQVEQSPPQTAVSPNWLERQKSSVVGFILAASLLFGIPVLLLLCCMLSAMILIFLNAK